MILKHPPIRWTVWPERERIFIMDRKPDRERATAFELLAGRLALMRELAASLEQVQTAIVRSNLAGITGHIALQRELCQAVRQLETEAPQWSSTKLSAVRIPRAPLPAPEDAASGLARHRWNAVAKELIEVEIRVGQLNLVYGALVRRARRTVDIFNRALACSANTYAPPKRDPAISQPKFGEISHV